MKFSLDHFWVDFNNCRFGLAARPPVLIVEPAEFEAEADGRCEITRAAKVTLRLELKYLDSGFAYLWNSRGELTGLREEAYRASGLLTLVCSGPEPQQCAGEKYCCAGARLLPGAAYCRTSETAGGYRLEFELEPPDGAAYLTRL